MAPEHWESYVFHLVDLSPGAARRRFRQSIKDAWGCCAYCGRSQGDTGEALNLTLDHVRPRSYGGSSLRSNLLPACRRCNLSKGSERDWHAWFLRQQFYCMERAERIRRWLVPNLSSGDHPAVMGPELEDVISPGPGDWEHGAALAPGLGGGRGGGLGAVAA